MGDRTDIARHVAQNGNGKLAEREPVTLPTEQELEATLEFAGVLVRRLDDYSGRIAAVAVSHDGTSAREFVAARLLGDDPENVEAPTLEDLGRIFSAYTQLAGHHAIVDRHLCGVLEQGLSLLDIARRRRAE